MSVLDDVGAADAVLRAERVQLLDQRHRVEPRQRLADQPSLGALAELRTCGGGPVGGFLGELTEGEGAPAVH